LTSLLRDRRGDIGESGESAAVSRLRREDMCACGACGAPALSSVASGTSGAFVFAEGSVSLVIPEVPDVMSTVVVDKEMSHQFMLFDPA
jgi:hypothetical protein